MRVLDDVVDALSATGVARQPIFLAKGVELPCPARDDLVNVGLVTGIPDDGVVRAHENAMQGDGELDHAEIRPQMPTCCRHFLHQERADLGGKFGQLLRGKRA